MEQGNTDRCWAGPIGLPHAMHLAEKHAAHVVVPPATTTNRWHGRVYATEEGWGLTMEKHVGHEGDVRGGCGGTRRPGRRPAHAGEAPGRRRGW
jgi:hypothetical protein